jgi:hypothetical protein
MDYQRIKKFLFLSIVALVALVTLVCNQMEDYLTQSHQKITVSVLTPKNYFSWIQEIKRIASRAQVWEYVDSDGSEPESVAPKYFKFQDYIKIVPADTLAFTQSQTIIESPSVLVSEKCTDYDDLSVHQQKSYDAKERSYRALLHEAKSTGIGIQKVHTAVLESARSYISVSRKASSVREILISLTLKFKRKDEDLQLQVDQKYEELKVTHSVKNQIES